jgi:hypothetical protein
VVIVIAPTSCFPAADAHESPIDGTMSVFTVRSGAYRLKAPSVNAAITDDHALENY